MNPCALPIGVSALASAIACHVESDEELAMIAAVFTQLGDTLETILAQRVLCARPKPVCQKEKIQTGCNAEAAAEESPYSHNNPAGREVSYGDTRCNPG